MTIIVDSARGSESLELAGLTDRALLDWVGMGSKPAIDEWLRRKGNRSLRFNPNHDAKGKFASAAGNGGGSTKGSGGYRPGAWTKPTTEQVTEHLGGMIAEDIRLESWDYKGAYGLSEAEALSQGMDQAKAIIEQTGPGKALVNGDNWVMAGRNFRVTDKEMASVASLVDGHQTTNPVPDGQPANVYIQSSFTMSDYGLTEVHTGNITLNAWVLQAGRSDRYKDMMPSARTTSALEYTLAHEWGHTQQEVKDPVSDKLFDPKDPNLSAYARSGGMMRTSHEAYAECFAEYTLTGGKTTNPTVRKYADTFGWKVP